MTHTKGVFSKNAIVYGQDAKAKQNLQTKTTRAKTTMATFPHEAAFKPARRGHGDPIAKFPEHILPKTS